MDSPTPAPLTLNDRPFTLAQLRADADAAAAAEGGTNVQPQSLSENARHTLRFCRAWLGEPNAFVVHTSGSTGQPKPITLTRTQMETSSRLTGRALGLQPGDRALVCLPTRYIAGRMMLVRGFVLGLPMTVVEPSSNPLRQIADNAAFEFTALTPHQLHTMLSESPRAPSVLNHMRAILVGGGPVSTALHARIRTLAAPIYHTYGMTETVTHIALRRLNGPDASDAFTPLEGVQLDLDDRGCLTIRAPVTRGRVLHTNDRVELRPDGSFVWLGRVDNVINSGGVKVQVEPVETALEQVLHILDDGRHAERRFFVGPLPDARLGQRVAAILEGAPLSTQTEERIRKALAQTVDRYALPRTFVYLPQLVETPTGKIDRPANLRALETHRGQPK